MKTKITIPEPCNENWNEMTPTEKGAFCQLCSKEVKDFTKSTDQEILKVLETSKENICGHVSSTQINRPLQGFPSYSKWFLPFATSFSIVIIPFAASAQNEIQMLGEVAIQKPVKIGKIAVKCDKPTTKIDTSTTLDGFIKTEETKKEPETLVNGFMVLNPTKSTEKGKTAIDSAQLTHSPDTIKLDSIPFRKRPSKDLDRNPPVIPTATAFPNPTKNWTTIQVETEGLYNVSIFNNTGRVILKKSFFGTEIKINLKHQSAGIYYIILINSEGVKSKSIKIIKT